MTLVWSVTRVKNRPVYIITDAVAQMCKKSIGKVLLISLGCHFVQIMKIDLYLQNYIFCTLSVPSGMSDVPSGQAECKGLWAFYWIALDSANLEVFILHLVLLLNNQALLHPKITITVGNNSR